MKHYDLIIIGGGAAGLSAASHAAEAGKEILVLEALPKLGGNGIFAEEMFALNSKKGIDGGVENDLDGWFNLAMEHSHWKNNARLTHNLLNYSGKNLDWLCDHGLPIAGTQPESVPGLGISTYFTQGMHTGREVMAILQEFCLSHPAITVSLKTRAMALITDPKGAVVGVRAEGPEGEAAWYSDKVILATGGFGGNPELIRRIIPGIDATAFAHLRGIRMKGDGILMAEKAGAELCSDGCFENAGPTYAGASEVMTLVTKRYALWLNRQGKRFCNEAVGDNFVFGCNAVYAQPQHMCYVLLDEAMVRQALTGPVDFLAGPEAVKHGTSGVLQVLNKEAEKGRVCISGELGTIARFMGAEEDTLRKEIWEYNEFCRAGRDPLFRKPASLLQPLAGGNYVCIRCGVDYILTHGGIRVNEEMAVQRADGTVIPNLYAAGVDISGVDSAGYQVTMGGHSLGFSLTGGRWAAQCAMAEATN